MIAVGLKPLRGTAIERVRSAASQGGVQGEAVRGNGFVASPGDGSLNPTETGLLRGPVKGTSS